MARSRLRSSFTPLATTRNASMSRPESVSSRMARVGSRSAIWKISFRFFLPPEKPPREDPVPLLLASREAGVHRPLDQGVLDLDDLRLLLDELEELDRVQL